MQNKGAIKFLAVILSLACLYQLSFTVVTKNVENEANKIAAGNPAVEAAYLDSMKNQVVYNLGFINYTYSEAKDKEINLGLDLRGGMNVTLQISVKDVIIALSDKTRNPEFNQAIELAVKKQNNSRNDFISLFQESYEEIAPNGKLSDIFSTYDLKESITPTSTNDEVIAVLRINAESAIANSYNVLRNRIDRFGVSQPNIQRLDNGRILVELPGVKDPERVSKLLQGTASLEFWVVYENQEVFPMLQNINSRLAEINASKEDVKDAEEKVKETPTEAADAGLLGNISDSTLLIQQNEKQNPFFSLVQPSVDQAGNAYKSGVVGYIQAKDTAKVFEILSMPQIKSQLPRTIKFMLSVKPIEDEGNIYGLYAINMATKDGKATLDGGAVTEARAEYSQFGSSAEVVMIMNPQGARTWAKMTSDNINKFIAVVLDGTVYSCPSVNTEIPNGISQITGDFTINEATDLANVLKSGRLPAPATIVKETVVGPSLGKESIDAGIYSSMIAFVLVLLYMIFFYSTAGLMASAALIANLFFLLGILASFGAVLTLPGIAGIVLTMGMAVDANVIIYERIKEELAAGKILPEAVRDGFSNAYSAILDGNATTFITGVVLFSFGSGPVQGFATTLIIGILTSLFCSIFITRLLLSTRVDNGKKIAFSNKYTENFLKNINFDFVGKRKYAYIISAAMIVLSLGSLAVRGLSYGVEFSGGRTYVVRFDGDVEANKVREALSSSDAFSSGLEVKQFGDDTQMRITTQFKYDKEGSSVDEEINHLLYDQLSPLYINKLTYSEFTTNTNVNGIISWDKVGPSIAHDIAINSFIAVFLSLLAIGLYIIIRFKGYAWACGGVISLFHDSLITVGAFSMLWGILPFDLDVNQAFIAAILTIIGYSINDTVVIFDRIREYRELFPKRDMKDNINAAINSTLARTLNTAGSTLVVLIAIFLFGGEVIRGFIFALAFGVIMGTYSSIYVATPVAYDFIIRQAKKFKK